MKTKKEIQVHMLPTEDASNIVKLNSGNILYNYREPVKAWKPHHTNQHLYFTSDEKGKQGWNYNYGLGKVEYLSRDYEEYTSEWNFCRKIIATTDASLTIKTDEKHHKFQDVKWKDAIIEHLPQPSQAFIEKYCEAGGIENILVEYEEY